MGQNCCKPKYWHDELLGAVTFGPRVGCQEIGCGSTYRWDDLGNVAWRFKDKAWKRGGALRVELEEFLDRAMERTEGAVEEPRLKYTASAFCCGGCWNPDFVTPELVEEFKKVLEENKNKKLSDMGLQCRAMCLGVRGGHGSAPTLFVLVEKVGDYERFTPSESYAIDRTCVCL